MSNRRDRDDAVQYDSIRERQAEAIFRIVADHAFDALDPADPRNARFFEWWARDLRERQTPEQRYETEQRAAEFAARLTRRWARDVLGLRSKDSAPSVGRANITATTAQAVELAEPGRKAPYLDLAVAAGAGRELWDEECTEWIDVPDDVPAGKHLALRVAGESMTPFLHEGDTVLVRLGPELTSGSIVVARRPEEGYVVKRVGQIRRRSVELVSLNPGFEPIRLPRDPRLLLGTVVLRWCTHGTNA
jgi:phage repressor protein C with HTH and peptisase S24 domain